MRNVDFITSLFDNVSLNIFIFHCNAKSCLVTMLICLFQPAKMRILLSPVRAMKHIEKQIAGEPIRGSDAGKWIFESSADD